MPHAAHCTWHTRGSCGTSPSQVRAHNATLGAVSAVSKGTGSVYLLDVAATGADVALNYRQPGGRVCLASDLEPSQAAFVPASDPWANCDARGFFEGTISCDQLLAVLVPKAGVRGQAQIFMQAASAVVGA